MAIWLTWSASLTGCANALGQKISSLSDNTKLCKWLHEIYDKLAGVPGIARVSCNKMKCTLFSNISRQIMRIKSWCLPEGIQFHISFTEVVLHEANSCLTTVKVLCSAGDGCCVDCGCERTCMMVTIDLRDCPRNSVVYCVQMNLPLAIWKEETWVPRMRS